jgi:arylsulfatase A-like enzyme
MSWEGVRGERFKYARYTDRDPEYEFLHDLENDPDELVNLVENPEFEAILNQLRKRTQDLAEAYTNTIPSRE